MIKHLKDEDFKDLVKEGKVLVDFYAEWCGPCKMMGEVLETFEDVNIIKVNTDEHTDLALSFGVMSIPTLILFKDGKEADKMIGMHDRTELENFINQ